jgi:pyruvate-formate lyase-activating enzyme
MQLETTNLCNFSCKMCPVHRRVGGNPQKRGFIDLELCREIIRQAAEFPRLHIIPQGAGEAFLHPNILEILETIRRYPNLTIGFNTNGSRLEGDLFEAVLELPLDDLGLSLDADTPETFRQVTGNDGFHEVVERFERLIEERARRGRSKPYLRVLMVDLDVNRHEQESFVRRWIDKVDEVVIMNERTITGRGAERINFSEPRREPCLHLWHTIFIQWDGRYDICCDDWGREVDWPHVSEVPLREFWFGPELTAARAAHRRGQYYRLPLCADCRSWVDRPERLHTTSRWRRHTEPLIRRFYRRT